MNHYENIEHSDSFECSTSANLLQTDTRKKVAVAHIEIKFPRVRRLGERRRSGHQIEAEWEQFRPRGCSLLAFQINAFTEAALKLNYQL